MAPRSILFGCKMVNLFTSVTQLFAGTNFQSLFSQWVHCCVVTGSRINGKLEMGMASLSFKYVLPSDMGQYVCCVTTEHGRAESQSAELVVEATKNLITDTQLKEPKGMLPVSHLF